MWVGSVWSDHLPARSEGSKQSRVCLHRTFPSLFAKRGEIVCCRKYTKHAQAGPLVTRIRIQPQRSPGSRRNGGSEPRMNTDTHRYNSDSLHRAAENTEFTERRKRNQTTKHTKDTKDGRTTSCPRMTQINDNNSASIGVISGLTFVCFVYFVVCRRCSNRIGVYRCSSVVQSVVVSCNSWWSKSLPWLRGADKKVRFSSFQYLASSFETGGAYDAIRSCGRGHVTSSAVCAGAATGRCVNKSEPQIRIGASCERVLPGNLHSFACVSDDYR